MPAAEALGSPQPCDVSGGDRRDFLEAITADHRTIREIFDRLRTGPVPGGDLLSELAVEVTAHLKSEELALFGTLTAREAARVLPTNRIWSESVLGEWARLYLANSQMREALMFPFEERERAFLVHSSFCESRVLPQLARHTAAVRADLCRRYEATVREVRAQARRELVGLRVFDGHAACTSAAIFPALPERNPAGREPLPTTQPAAMLGVTP